MHATSENHEHFEDKDLQLFLGNLLRYGVLISLGVVLIGLFLYLFQSGKELTPFSTFIQQDFDFTSFFNGLFHGESYAIMALGVMLLILTPIMRVVFAIIGFHWEKDRLYTLISCIVLLIIIFSAILGAVS
jgi:uncharacterized membrane protein